MLSMTPQQVCFIIIKAREFDEKEQIVEPDPASNPSDDRGVEVLEDYPDDPTLEELVGAIESLNDDGKLDLVALAWIGRGDFTAESWEEARRQAEDVRDKHFASYLTGMPKLGDLLEEGLAALGYSCEEFEIDRL